LEVKLKNSWFRKCSRLKNVHLKRRPPRFKNILNFGHFLKFKGILNVEILQEKDCLFERHSIVGLLVTYFLLRINETLCNLNSKSANHLFKRVKISMNVSKH